MTKTMMIAEARNHLLRQNLVDIQIMCSAAANYGFWYVERVMWNFIEALLSLT
jgi:hypothetical protein